MTEQKARLIELLNGYCTHVPPRINSASIQVVLDFKRDVAAGRALLNRASAKDPDLQAAINKLYEYWSKI